MAKHEDLPVPIHSFLEPVYGQGSQLEEAQLRFNNLKAKFLQFFGREPQVFARSPGSSCSEETRSDNIQTLNLVLLCI